MSETNKIAHANAGIKAIELEDERMLRVIATAPTLDRDLEVIDTRSIQVPVKPRGLKYAAELSETDEIDLPFLIDHDWRLEKQAGSVKSMFMNQNGELEVVVKLSTVDNGERVYTLAKEGHLGNSFSIGYSLQNATLEDGVIKNIEMTEFSGVFKGSNRDARLLAVKSIKEEKSMALSQEELAAKQAEIEKLTKEIDDAKVEETPVVEKPVEQPKVDEPKTEESQTVVEAPEVEVVAETKPKEEESTKMADNKEIAVKQIVEAPAVPVQEVKAAEKIDKYDFAAKQFVAYVNKDTKTLSELNKKAIASYEGASGSKATYLNTAILADGGAIVPEAQLLADVYTILDEYSTVASDLRVVTLTEGNSLNIASLIQDVIVTEVTTEGGNKPVTKPVFGEDELALREFAGIAILTKKLVRQAAVNVFDILRDSFARAIARKRAELALTDATSGIVNQTGVGTIAVAATDGIATYAELRTAPYQIPAGAVRNAKYYLSREQLAALDGEINPVTNLSTDVVRLSGDGLSGTLANGFAFAVEEELGTGGAPHVVFGSMSRFGILLRQGVVEAETFDTGVVTDGSSVEHNLLQQNKLAHRVAFYENVGFPLPGAFAVSDEPA